MLMYALICLSLVLLGIVGLQFTYLFWVDRIYRERRTYLKDLENRYSDLNSRLRSAERQVAEQAELLEVLGYIETETWADVIEER